jgi:hypothetical protein
MSLPIFEFIKAAAKDKTSYCTLIISPYAFEDDIFDEDDVLVTSEAFEKETRAPDAIRAEESAGNETRAAEEIEAEDVEIGAADVEIKAADVENTTAGARKDKHNNVVLRSEIAAIDKCCVAEQDSSDQIATDKEPDGSSNQAQASKVFKGPKVGPFGYFGVTRVHDGKRSFIAHVTFYGDEQRRVPGVFMSPVEAALAHDEYAMA